MTQNPTQPRVLMVDDDTEILAMFATGMTGAPFEFVTAHGSMEALALCQREHFDLLIIDIDMPLMDGVELSARLRHGGCKAPILVLTAHGQHVTDQLAIEGATVLHKPKTPAELRGEITARLGI